MPKNSPVRNTTPSNIRFQYVCVNCGAPAKKPALRNQKDWKSLSPSDFNGLGTWHCTGSCRGKVKVQRRHIELRQKEVA